MSIAAIGFYGSKGPFWAMPSMFLTGSAAASGIAWINGVGNLGGFFGPTAVGWAKNYSGSFTGGLYALACFSLVSAIVAAFWLHIPNPARQRSAGERSGRVSQRPCRFPKKHDATTNPFCVIKQASARRSIMELQQRDA